MFALMSNQLLARFSIEGNSLESFEIIGQLDEVWAVQRSEVIAGDNISLTPLSDPIRRAPHKGRRWVGLAPIIHKSLGTHLLPLRRTGHRLDAATAYPAY